MPKRLVLYKNGPSNSATQIVDAMRAHRVTSTGRYTPSRNDVILVWGTSEAPNWGNTLNGAKVLNHWDRVAVCADKHRTFQALQAARVPTPQFSTNVEDARRWVREGSRVFGRQLLNGHGGEGIVLCNTLEEVNGARGVRLWVKNFSSGREFRIFVMRNNRGQAVVIDGIEKKRREGAREDNNYSAYIRSHDRGWVFCREGVVVPESVNEAAKATLMALNMDLGAVDIRYNKDTRECAVLEMNSKFGIGEESTTLDSLTEALSTLLEGGVVQDNPDVIVGTPTPMRAARPLDVPVEVRPVLQEPTRPVEVRPEPVTVRPAQEAARAVAQPARTVTRGVRNFDLNGFTEIQIQEENGRTLVTGAMGNRRIVLLEIGGNVEHSARFV